MTIATAPEIRFWRHVEKTDGGCWLWTAHRNAKGYGVFGMPRRKLWLAHRFAWTMQHGSIPDGLYVLHRCDTPACVRVDHLFVGDQRANMRDSIRKERFMTAKRRANVPRGDAHYLRKEPGKIRRGSRSSTPKLTERDVLAIREKYARGATTQQELAAIYGVTFQNIHAIVTRKTWAHI